MDSRGSGTFSAPVVEALLPFVASGRSDKTFDIFWKRCNAERKGPTTFEKFFALVAKFYRMSVFPTDEVEEDHVRADLCAGLAPFDSHDTSMVDSSVGLLSWKSGASCHPRSRRTSAFG